MIRQSTHSMQDTLCTTGMLGTSLTTQEARPCEPDIQVRSINFVFLGVPNFAGNLLKMVTVRLQKPWLKFDKGSCHLPPCHSLAGLFHYRLASIPRSTFPLQSTSCFPSHTPLIQDTFELRCMIVIVVWGGPPPHSLYMEEGKGEGCWSQIAWVDGPAPAFPCWVDKFSNISVLQFPCKISLIIPTTKSHCEDSTSLYKTLRRVPCTQ